MGLEEQIGVSQMEGQKDYSGKKNNPSSWNLKCTPIGSCFECSSMVVSEAL